MTRDLVNISAKVSYYHLKKAGGVTVALYTGPGSCPKLSCPLALSIYGAFGIHSVASGRHYCVPQLHYHTLPSNT